MGHFTHQAIQSLEEAIDYINQHQRPLALYVMSDKSTIKHIVCNTHSGGVGINDTVLHVGAEDAPSVALVNQALVIITEWKDSEPLAMRKLYPHAEMAAKNGGFNAS